MFDAVLDVVFPVVFLSLPTLAAIYLAGLVFGKAETIAAVKVVGVVAVKALLNIGRRFQRAALAFVSDDAIPAVDGKWRSTMTNEMMLEIDRLDTRIDNLHESILVARGEKSVEDYDVEASTPF